MITSTNRMRDMLTASIVTLAVAGTLAQGGPPPPGSFQRVPPLPFPDAARELELSGTAYRVVPVVKGLVTPWGLTFLPDGEMLVTERPGRLRIVRNGTLDPQPIAGTPEVWATGQGGLLEVLPAPAIQREPLAVSDVLEGMRHGGDDGADARAVRRQGADRDEGSVRGGQLQHGESTLWFEARVRARRRPCS